jgi:hypothetical protein
MKNEQLPIIQLLYASLFGILPGIAFALSIYLSLAIVTLIGRLLWILR